jgi:hypothetical protein
MRVSDMLHKTGAICYALWGFLHLAAVSDQYKYALELEVGMTQGRLLQGASYLFVMSLIAIVVAMFMNWRNSRTGYWINLVVVALADIPFILFVLMPGHIAIFPGIVGPLLWAAGLIFTTLGLRDHVKSN